MRNFGHICKKLATTFCVFLSVSLAQPPRKVIIDTDGVLDDARALLLAFHGQSALDILAITTTNSQAASNVRRIRALAKRENVSIYVGQTECLTQPCYGEGPDVFSRLGDVPNLQPRLENTRPAETNVTAPEAIRALINQNRGQVTLVCLAKLTNVALAFLLDSAVASLLKELIIVGGSYKAGGNFGPYEQAEYNFYSDPESAAIVLKAGMDCKVKTFLFTWDLSASSLISHADWSARYFSQPTAAAQFMNTIFTRARNSGTFLDTLFDEVAIAFLINPSIATKTAVVSVAEIELSGKFTRGVSALKIDDSTTISFQTARCPITTGVQLVLEYNVPQVRQMLLDSVSPEQQDNGFPNEPLNTNGVVTAIKKVWYQPWFPNNQGGS